MAKPKLIPGFRFHPTDVELVKYFLKRKVMGKKFFQVIAELDIYRYSPWDLPDKSCLRTGDLEWYFFCHRGKKYGSGSRTNRSTKNGYWKATGKDRAVQHDKQSVGMIKTLVFHTGKAPDGDRTDWVMHEYRLEDKDLTSKGIAQDSYVICKVFQKQGPGPRNGAQYGRPFNEEDWDNDEEGEIPSAALSAQVPILTMTSNSSPQAEQHLPPSGSIEATSMSCLSGPVPSPSEPANPSDSSNQAVPPPSQLANPSVSSNQAVNNDDDILTMHDLSKEGNKTPEKVDNRGQENIAEPSSDIFESLGDLDNWATLDDFFSGENAGDAVGFDDWEYVGLSDLGSP